MRLTLLSFVFLAQFMRAECLLKKLNVFSRQTLNQQVGDFEFGETMYLSSNYFAQRVSVAFDLESPITLLYDGNYVNKNNWPTVPDYEYYRPQDSLSFDTQNKTFKLDFNSDTQQIKSSVGGIWSTDTVSQLFDDSPSVFKKAGFGLVQSGDNFQPKDKKFAYTGRLGMSLNGSGSTPNWIVQAMKNDYNGLITFLISDNMYYLSIGVDASNDENCDSSNALASPVVETSPELGKQHWQVASTGFSFGKYSFSNTQYIRFTLSTAYLYGPQTLVQKVRDTIKAYEEGGRWIVNCNTVDKLGSLTFMFNRKQLVFPSSVYVLKDTDKNECYLALNAFSDKSNTDHWAFGAIFASKYCLTLDFTKEEVTFQPSKATNGIKLNTKASDFIESLMKGKKN